MLAQEVVSWKRAVSVFVVVALAAAHAARSGDDDMKMTDSLKVVRTTHRHTHKHMNISVRNRRLLYRMPLCNLLACKNKGRLARAFLRTSRSGF